MIGKGAVSQTSNECPPAVSHIMEIEVSIVSLMVSLVSLMVPNGSSALSGSRVSLSDGFPWGWHWGSMTTRGLSGFQVCRGALDGGQNLVSSKFPAYLSVGVSW